MVNYKEIKLSYTCPAFLPEGIYIDKAYHIIKKDGKFYFTDGISEFEGEEDYIKMLFSPNGDVKWEEIDFKEVVKEVNKLIFDKSNK